MRVMVYISFAMLLLPILDIIDFSLQLLSCNDKYIPVFMVLQ